MGNTIAKKYKIRWPPHSGVQFAYTLEEYRAKFEEYLIYCLDEHRQPFLMDFASFCGITDQTARNYAKRGDTEEEKAAWQELHELIVQYTEVEMWQAMLAGKVKERAASMFLINFNKRVANRTISDNRNETTSTVKITGIQRTIIDPDRDKQAVKEELARQKAEHQAGQGAVSTNDSESGSDGGQDTSA